MSGGQNPSATAPGQTALPCAACRQPVIEKRSADGALVVLDSATKRLHLCVKRKDSDAAKVKQSSGGYQKASRKERSSRPAKVVVQSSASDPSRQPQARPSRTRIDRPARPLPVTAVEAPRKAARRKPKKTTLRSRAQVEEILKQPLVRWRTGDGPTSFCAECRTPVLVGFSHVRWDVMMLDAAGHHPHDCAASRLAAVALGGDQPIPDRPAVVEPARRLLRPMPPVAIAAPSVNAEAKPRHRPGRYTLRAAANTCEACGNLQAMVNGEWVCLHCGA